MKKCHAFVNNIYSSTHLPLQAVRIPRLNHICLCCLIEKARQCVANVGETMAIRIQWENKLKKSKKCWQQYILPCKSARSDAVSLWMDLRSFDAPDFNKKYTIWSWSKMSNWIASRIIFSITKIIYCERFYAKITLLCSQMKRCILFTVCSIYVRTVL